MTALPKICSVILLLAFGIYARGQVYTFHGEVKDANGNIPEEVILIISGSQDIFYTDLQGKFSVQLDYKPDRVTFKAPGYYPRTVSLPFNYDEKLFITLDSITDNTYFDPAAIIQKAQLKRAENERLYTGFTSRYYIKNRARFNKIPFNIWPVSGRVIPAKSDTGLVFISEKKGLFKYKDRNHYDVFNEAINSGGSFPVPSWVELPEYDLSLFHSKIYVREVSTRGYYSPLCDDALKFYDFERIGEYFEDKRKVYRIKFTPKGKKYAAFSGTMDLYDQTFTLAAADFSITQGNQLELVDSIRVKQIFYYQNGRYKAASQKLAYYLDIIGYSGYYDMHLYYHNHHFTDSLSFSDFDRQVLEIDRHHFQPDSIYWEKKRAVPITKKEKTTFFRQNLNSNYQNYLLLNSPLWWSNEFRFSDWTVTGHESFKQGVMVDWDPLWYTFGYNTVEGLYLNYCFPVKWVQPLREWKVTPSIRYGFSDTRLKASLKTSYKFNLLKPVKLSLSGGHDVEQFNDQQPILPVINSLYSLFISQNFLKLYGKDYLEFGYDQELLNGLELISGLEFAWRYPLFNTTDFRIIGNPNSFTPNNPENLPVISSEGFKAHHALTLNINLSYQFNHLYKVMMGRKVNLVVRNAPKLYFNFKAGIPSGFSETDFAFIEGGMAYNIRLRNIGLSQFDISSGGFLYSNRLPFIDYKHFNGIQTFFLQPTPRRSATIKQFSTLPYYEYSTARGYLELHYEHNFDGFLLSQFGPARRAKVHSLVGCNYLNSFNEAQFLEFFIGFDNILKVLRLEFAGGIDNFKRLRPSVRLGVDFDYLYYKNNRKR